MTLVEGSINNQTSLIIYGGPNTLAETSSEPCLIEVPPNYSTMSQGSWYNDMWMATSLATDFSGWTPLHLPQGSTGTLTRPHISTDFCLALFSHCSVLAHVFVQWLAVLCSISPQQRATFPAPLMCYGRVLATLFQRTACPMDTVPLREERRVPEACPFLPHKAVGPAEPGFCT